MRDLTRREAVALLGAAAAAAIAGCFSDRPDDGTGLNEGTLVEMTAQLTFSPATVNIRVGDAVTWRNTSGFPHTATADPAKASDPANVQLPAGAAPWDSGILTAGGEYTHTFDVAGTYRYFCIPHESQGMLGTIVVAP